MDARSGLRDLLQPIEPEAFFSDFFEHRSLLLRRNDSHYYDAILELPDLDVFFRSTSIPSEFIRMHRAGQEIDASYWSKSGYLVHDRVAELFHSGATFIVNGGFRFFPSLDLFCHRVEAELRYGVQPNVYITPGGEQGFVTHYDDHDVFILHLLGRKTWRMYGSPVRLPSRRQCHVSGQYDAGEPEAEFDLEPGDLLYIPRGVFHDARSQADAAAHITFGLHPTYMYQLIDELARTAQDQALFRKAIPHGFSGEEQWRRFKSDFRGMLLELIEQASIDDLLAARHRAFLSAKRPLLHNRFSDLIQATRLSDESVVARRAEVPCSLERTGQELQLLFAGNKLTFPRFLEPALCQLLSTEPFALSDVPGLFDERGRIELASRLVAMGLLEIRWLDGSSE